MSRTNLFLLNIITSAGNITMDTMQASNTNNFCLEIKVEEIFDSVEHTGNGLTDNEITVAVTPREETSNSEELELIKIKVEDFFNTQDNNQCAPNTTELIQRSANLIQESSSSETRNLIIPQDDQRYKDNVSDHQPSNDAIVNQTGNPLKMDTAPPTKLVIDRNYQKFKHNLFNTPSIPMYQNTETTSRVSSNSNEVSKAFPCLLCAESFLLKKELEQHIIEAHESVLYECKICGKKYKDKNVFKIHFQRHGKTFQCKECGKILRSQSTLKNHAYTHQKVKPYKCRFCDKTFAYSNGRNYHIKTHHLEEQGLNPKKQDFKFHSC
eukprot:TCONS_00057627-protein